MPLHALVAGFGRGKFREIKLDGGEEGALNPEKEIAFHLEDSSDLVLLENKATTLSEAVTARNDSTGQAAIAYHTMVNKPGESGFSLKQDRSLVQGCCTYFFLESRNYIKREEPPGLGRSTWEGRRPIFVCSCDYVQDQKIAFKPDDLEGQASGGITQNMGALTMPCGYWNTNTTSCCGLEGGPHFGFQEMFID